MKRNSKRDSQIIIFICIIALIIIMIGYGIWVMIPAKPKAAAVVKTVEAEAYEVIAEETVCEPSYTDDELFYMAAAIYNEAGGDACSDSTRRLVGYVILNRVNDSRFPSTIKDVLEQKSQYGRFHWTGIKFADRASLPQEKNAVDRAYRIAKEVLEADTIPIPSTVVYQAEFPQGVELYVHQDGMYFCHAKEVK